MRYSLSLWRFNISFKITIHRDILLGIKDHTLYKYFIKKLLIKENLDLFLGFELFSVALFIPYLSIQK